EIATPLEVEIYCGHTVSQTALPPGASTRARRRDRPGAGCPAGRGGAGRRSPRLSKSKFTAGIQCLKRLYLRVHQPELAGEIDQAQDARLGEGEQVGDRHASRSRNLLRAYSVSNGSTSGCINPSSQERSTRRRMPGWERGSRSEIATPLEVEIYCGHTVSQTALPPGASTRARRRDRPGAGCPAGRGGAGR